MKLESSTPSRRNKQPPKNTVLIVAIILIVVALVVAGIFIFVNMRGGDENLSSKPSSDISEITSSEDEASSDIEEEEDYPDEFDPETGILTQYVDMHRQYPDFIGRLYIPGTLLDNDIVLSKEKGKEEFYLNHNLDGEKFAYGVPFIDARATFDKGFQSTVLTIYGHNSSNGDYFEGVKSYTDIDFYKEKPIMYFDTIYGTGKYKILGLFTEYVGGDRNDWWRYHDAVNIGEDALSEYLKELDKRNYYDTGIDVLPGDQILALSTCNDDIVAPLNTPYRDVLVARKIRPDESKEVDISQIKPNYDMVMPQGWVDKYKKANPHK